MLRQNFSASAGVDFLTTNIFERKLFMLRPTAHLLIKNELRIVALRPDEFKTFLMNSLVSAIQTVCAFLPFSKINAS